MATTPITEEVHREDEDEKTTSDNDDAGEEDVDDDDDEWDCAPLGTGNLWVTMKLAWKIPQFLPMMGRKIEVYHRGINLTCVNCYQEGHKRKDCPNERVQWLDYVSYFIENNDLRPELYGRWFQLTEAMRNKYRLEPGLEEEAAQTGSYPETGVEVRKDAMANQVGGDGSVLVDNLGPAGQDRARPPTQDTLCPQQAELQPQQTELQPQQRQQLAKPQPQQRQQQEQRQLPNQEQQVAAYRNSASYRQNVGARSTKNGPKFNEVTMSGLNRGQANQEEPGTEQNESNEPKSRPTRMARGRAAPSTSTWPGRGGGRGSGQNQP